MVTSETVTPHFVGLLPDIEMNEIPSPALPLLTAKAYIQGLADISLTVGRLSPSKQLTSTLVQPTNFSKPRRAGAYSLEDIGSRSTLFATCIF